MRARTFFWAPAMVCNFPRPSSAPGAPRSCLTHDDVEMLFHEFGHAVHFVCTRTPLPHFNAFQVETDFLEVPSQMLENWCWDVDMLCALSGGRLPVDLARKVCSARKVRQLFFIQTDVLVHALGPTLPDGAALVAAVNALQTSFYGISHQPDCSVVFNFEHLASGYDARYYSYLWSEVYSADIFATLFCRDEGVSLTDFDAVAPIGSAYRDTVLAPGSSRPAMDLLLALLGRAPSVDAFAAIKGLTS